jgi:hypothetical protein
MGIKPVPVDPPAPLVFDPPPLPAPVVAPEPTLLDVVITGSC